MSNGGKETLRVIDPGFYEQLNEIPAGYIITFEKLGLPEANKAIQSITYNVNVHGNNARVNHQSVDNSTNIVHDSAAVANLIAELRQEIKNLSLSDSEKTEASEIVDEVEAQFTVKKPKRSVIKTMLSALPHVESIANIVSALIKLVN